MTGVLDLVRGAPNRARLVAAVYCAIGVLAAAMFVGVPHVPMSGSPMGLMLIVALALGPVLLALTLARPLIVPFAFWAALVPFDNLISIGGLVRLGKPLGALAAFAALITILVRRRALVPSLSAGIWALLLFVCTLSLYWARSADFGILELQQLAGLFVVGVILAMIPADRLDLTGLALGVLGGGIAAGLYAIIMYAVTGHPLFIGASERLIDHNHFGASLLLPSFVATSAAIALRSPWMRAAAVLAAGLCLAGITVSQSRGALIAFGIGLAYLALRSPNRRRLLTFLVGGIILVAATPGTLARFNNSDAGDAAGRYQIWHIGFESFKHNWFAGHGFGTFMQSYQAAFLEYSQTAATAQRIQNSHNMFVEFAVELGVVGLILIFAVWYAQFRTLREIQPSSGGWFEMRLAVESATLALFISTLSLDLLTFKYTWLAITSVWIVRSAYRTMYVPRAPAVPENGLVVPTATPVLA